MNSLSFARLTSLLFIPPIVSFCAFTVLVLTYETGDAEHIATIWLVAVLFCGLFQILHVLWLWKKKHVTVWDVPQRDARAKPYLVSAGLCFFGFILLALMNASLPVLGLAWCFAINTLLLERINTRWKISAHLMGLTGAVTYLFFHYGFLVLPSIPIAVLLAWARVRTGTHSIGEVIAGAVAGISLTLVQLPLIHAFG